MHMQKLQTFVAAAALVISSAVLAQAPLEYQFIPGVSPEPITAGAGLKSREELEAFIDGVMAAQLRAQHTAGAVVSVVKDGKLFFAKGYGYADVEKKIPVDAGKTLFRPGSVSKMFTWTALMQLVEQGKVGLDDDVNKYVTQFQVPDTYPGQPITIRNLFTHTEGMEDGGFGYLIVDKAEKVGPAAETLARHMPARVRAAAGGDFTNGDMSSYSNWGTSLAGLIVANVSGMSYDDYIDKYVLAPLDMTHSSARQPLPPALAGDMSVGYKFEAAQFKPQGFEFINFAPAGSMSATGADMGKFMIAHLNHGAGILKPETARLMQSRALSPNPHTNGAALGFYENHVNGRRLLVHAGDTLYFHSEMNLLPEENVGIFVSVNTAPTIPFSTRSDLLRAFMDRYYPAKLPVVKAPEDFKTRAANYAGSYRVIRHSYTTFEKVFGLASTIKVVPTDHNTLLGSLGPFAFEFVEVKPNVFRRVDQDDMIAFSMDENGKASTLLNAISLPNHPAYRIAGYETPAFLGLIAGFALLCFIVAIVSALRHWTVDGSGDRAATSGARRARRWAALLAAINLLFLVILGLLVFALTKNPFSDIPDSFRVGLVLPLLAIPLTLALLWFAVRAWREGWWTRYTRVQYTVIALGSLGFLWLLNLGNLIGWKFG